MSRTFTSPRADPLKGGAPHSKSRHWRRYLFEGLGEPGIAGGALGPPCLTSKGKCDGLEPQASTGFRGKGGSAVVATSEAEIPEDEDSALPSEAKQQFRLCS